VVDAQSECLLGVRGVSVRFGPIFALRNVSFSIRPGEVVRVLGPNGAGKSTLAAVLIGAIRPFAGRVLWEGTDVSDDGPRERWRRGVAIVPEGRGILTGLTVEENVRLGAGPTSARAGRIRAKRALAAVSSLKTLEQRLGGQLSGGQQQLVSLCRAMASEPRLLVLDEPLLGLDAGNRRLIANTVIDLQNAESTPLSVIVLEAEPLWPAISRTCTVQLEGGGLTSPPAAHTA